MSEVESLDLNAGILLDEPPPNTVPLNPDFYRAGTIGTKRRWNFVVGNGGIGDLICYVQSLRWVAATQPHVHGKVWTFKFFEPTVRAFLPEDWEFGDVKTLHKDHLPKEPFRFPDLDAFNAQGAHAIDLGFIYFTNQARPPKGWDHYPRIQDARVTGPLPDDIQELLKKPCVALTPGAMVDVRRLPSKTFNDIKDYLILKGFIPVLLGRTEIADHYVVGYDKDYDFTGCVDLRDRTSIVDTMRVIQGCKGMVGLDNGILHLAGCTDTPIVFGYNVAAPEHRRPRRDPERVYEVVPEIACRFCQSNVKFLTEVHKKCLYGDLKCLREDMVFHKWKTQIDLALGL